VNAIHSCELREKLNQEKVCVIPGDENFFLVNAEATSWNEISILDALLLYCIQDGHSFERIVRMLCTFRMSLTEAEEYSRGFLTRISRVVHAIPRQSHHPLTAYLHLTSACNLWCVYCYTKSTRTQHELDTDSWKDVIIQSAQVADTLVFSGGEPLLRDDVFELASCAKAQGLTTKLLTNGTLITPENCSLIAQCFDAIQISIDGSESVHNKTRGCYRAADAALNTMVMCSPRKVSVGITVTKENIGELPNFIYSLKARGVTKVHLNLLKPVTSRSRRYQPAVEHLEAFLQDLFHRAPLTVTNFDHIVPPIGECSLNCGAGTDVISLMPDGSMFPCEGLIRPSLWAGNVLETPLAECIKHSPVLQNLRKITVDQIAGCRTCCYRYFCGGGCRADALIFKGTLRAKDPFCQICKKLIETFMWKHRTWVL
jgi:radical SAM protein with 4Fe4S-binding SPASM domain